MIWTYDTRQRKPNRLFRTLIGISLVIHAVIFFHVSGLYKSIDLRYIELAMQDISKPNIRNIPKPPLNKKQPEKVEDVRRIDINHQIPRLEPIKVDPVDSAVSEGVVENIAIPQLSADTSSYSVSKWAQGLEQANYATINDYKQMVTLKIERYKEYPRMAQLNHIGGVVTIQFTIEPNGDATNIKIVKSSRQQILDEAAKAAIQKAVPFPAPPRELFHDAHPLMELTIRFEAT